MTEVHRYKVVKMLSEGGNRISYDPHGPEVVMAEAYDQLKAENEALRKDAERYRWLRDDEYLHAWADLHVCDEHRRAEVTDKAIDAAMAKEASHG